MCVPQPSAAKKVGILTSLEKLDFTDKTVWPEMDKAAVYITKRLSSDRTLSRSLIR